MSGEYEIAGSIGLYERENEQEKLKIPGPIKDDISVYVSAHTLYLLIVLIDFFDYSGRVAGQKSKHHNQVWVHTSS